MLGIEEKDYKNIFLTEDIRTIKAKPRYGTLDWGIEFNEIYFEKDETEKAKIKFMQAINVLKAFDNDFETEYTHSKYDPEKIKELEIKLSLIQ